MNPTTHFLLWADIPAELEAGFNEWYNREHVPDRVLGVPGFIQARRFVAVEGDLARAVAARQGLTQLDTARLQQLMRVAVSERSLG